MGLKLGYSTCWISSLAPHDSRHMPRSFFWSYQISIILLWFWSRLFSLIVFLFARTYTTHAKQKIPRELKEKWSKCISSAFLAWWSVSDEWCIFQGPESASGEIRETMEAPLFWDLTSVEQHYILCFFL